jgi:hypothetical protein
MKTRKIAAAPAGIRTVLVSGEQPAGGTIIRIHGNLGSRDWGRIKKGARHNIITLREKGAGRRK